MPKFSTPLDYIHRESDGSFPDNMRALDKYNELTERVAARAVKNALLNALDVDAVSVDDSTVQFKLGGQTFRMAVLRIPSAQELQEVE